MSESIPITNPRSSYFVHASDNPRSVFTNVILRGEENYDNWSKAMKNVLKAKNKLGFITGLVHKPDTAATDQAHAWEVCNSMINGWIRNTIDPKLQPYIPYFDNAKELWDDLKERYAVENILKQYQLNSSLSAVKQQGTTISSYYTKLRSIWDDLESCRSIPACSCGDQCQVAKFMAEETERDRVYQFLMVLDEEVFGNLRSQILNTSPLPSVNRMYSMVTQEETHKAITRSRDKRIYAVGFTVQAKPLQGTPHTEEGVTCSHCGKPGHDVSTCFRIVGYPFKNSSRGRGQGRT